MTRIAVLGTGNMGAAIARRLLDTGHRVTVWNRTPARSAGFPEVAPTPAAAVAGADLVVVMLRDARAVTRALSDAAPALRPAAVVAQMSTIAPDEVRTVAESLPVPLLDAPVGGSVDRASTGKLIIFVGGPRRLVDAAEPVLSHLGTIRHCGDIGAAAATKLMVNTAMLTALAALRDTLAVADRLGVDREAALDILAAGPLADAVRRATATGGMFAIDLAAKDLALALGLRPAAADAGAGSPDAPVAAATLRLLRAAEDQRADLATIVEQERP